MGFFSGPMVTVIYLDPDATEMVPELELPFTSFGSCLSGRAWIRCLDAGDKSRSSIVTMFTCLCLLVHT